MHDLSVALQHTGLDMEQKGVVALLAGLDLSHQGTVRERGLRCCWDAVPAGRRRGCSVCAWEGPKLNLPLLIQCLLCLSHKQVHVEEFLAAALDQRKVLNASTCNAIFGERCSSTLPCLVAGRDEPMCLRLALSSTNQPATASLLRLATTAAELDRDRDGLLTVAELTEALEECNIRWEMGASLPRPTGSRPPPTHRTPRSYPSTPRDSLLRSLTLCFGP